VTHPAPAGLLPAAAIDGKLLHGTRTPTGQVFLVAAITHHDGIVLGQRQVPDKRGETTVIADLLTPLPVVCPAFGDAGDEERRRVMAGAVDGLAHVRNPAVEIGDDLHVLPAHVLLAGEQAVIVLAFADRSDEPVDQHTFPVSLFEPLIDLRAGDPAQDRLQDLVIAGDGGLEQPNTSPRTSSGRLCRSPNSTAMTAVGSGNTYGRPTGGFSH
jgi:hypothetical protein